MKKRQPPTPTLSCSMSTIGAIIAEKGGAVVSIDGDATVFEAVKLMVESNVGAILVTGVDRRADRRHLHGARLPAADRGRGAHLTRDEGERGDERTRRRGRSDDDSRGGDGDDDRPAHPSRPVVDGGDSPG